LFVHFSTELLLSFLIRKRRIHSLNKGILDNNKDQSLEGNILGREGSLGILGIRNEDKGQKKEKNEMKKAKN
jgi:hypothetical protein